MNPTEALLKKLDSLSSEVVEVTKNLVSFRSVNPPGDEMEIAEYIYSYLKDLGFKCEKIQTGEKRINVIASFGQDNTRKGNRSILFNGHMDVVPVEDLGQWATDPFKAEVEGNVLFGRGTCDMKGGLASCLVAAKGIVESETQLDGKLQLHMVADEENGSELGTRALISKGLLKADAAIVMESSVFGGEIHARTAVRGLHWIEIETTGRSAHASQPDKGVNAVLKMSKLLLALDGFKLEHNRHPLLPPPSLAAGTIINGGVRPNMIPSSCKALLDVRTIPGMTEKDNLEQINGFIQGLAREDKELVASARTKFWWPPSEIDVNHEIVALAREATRLTTVKEITPRGASGSTDSSFISALAGIPALVFGPGDCLEGKAHGANEWVSVDRLRDFSKIYALMAIKYCNNVLVSQSRQPVI